MVGRLLAPVKALVEVRAQRCRQMRPGTKSDHSDFVGIDLPICRVRSNQSQALCASSKAAGDFG